MYAKLCVWLPWLCARACTLCDFVCVRVCSTDQLWLTRARGIPVGETEKELEEFQPYIKELLAPPSSYNDTDLAAQPEDADGNDSELGDDEPAAAEDAKGPDITEAEALGDLADLMKQGKLTSQILAEQAKATGSTPSAAGATSATSETELSATTPLSLPLVPLSPSAPLVPFSQPPPPTHAVAASVVESMDGLSMDALALEKAMLGSSHWSRSSGIQRQSYAAHLNCTCRILAACMLSCA